MNTKKLKKILATTFVLGFIIGGATTYLLSKTSDANEISKIRDFEAILVQDDKNEKEGILYKNDEYKITLYYPEGLIFKEFDEGGGATTVVFQAPGDASTGFQIYMSPYKESTITGERILRDVPSGIVNDLKEEQLTEDLLVATFTSRDPFVGETQEIWFLGNGYLYQVTTFGGLGDWLTEIIKTVEI